MSSLPGASRNSRPRDDAAASPAPTPPSAPAPPRPAASVGGARGGQFLRPQLPRFGPFGQEDEADEEEDFAEAPPPRDQFGARHGGGRAPAPRDESQSYPAAIPDDDPYDRSWDESYGEDDPYARSARDPWSRDWGAWSATYLPDEGFEEDEEALAGSWRRGAWGAQPSGNTMASVAIQVAPPARRRSAKPKGPAFQQVLRWVQSGFNAKERPTKKAIRLLLVTSILGVIVLSGLGTALYAYNDYRVIYGEAKEASTLLSHLSVDLGLGKGASTPLDAAQTQVALNADLGQAMRDLQDVRARLQHPDFVLSLAGAIPSVRDKLKSGLVLSDVGIDAVTMLQELVPYLASVANLLISSPIATTSTNNDPLLTSSALPALAHAFTSVQPIVAHMVQTIENTPPDVLVAALSAKQQGELLPLLSGVPQLPTILSIVSEFLTLKSAPALLGAPDPVAYLIMTLDNTELRPVGGFQGQYAVVGVNGGHVGHISLEDVYHTLEPVTYSDASGQTIQAYNGLKIPQQQWYYPYAVTPNGGGLGWALRNSGLSADFAQSARYALWYLHNETICNWTDSKTTPGYTGSFCRCPNYAGDPRYTCINGGDRIPDVDATGKITGYAKDQAKMAGVIMIQETVIEQLLDVVGPLQIGCPYNTTVDASSLLDKIHYYQETDAGRNIGKQKCGGAALSDSTKRFTALLTQSLQAKLKTLPKTQLFKFAGYLLNDLHTKDIQVYLTDPTAVQDSGPNSWQYASNTVYPPDPLGEGFLEKYQASSEMYHQGADDSLSLSRADMLGWKLERWIKVHLIDHIKVDSQGNATHTFQTKYDFNIPSVKVVKDKYGAIDQDATNQAIFSVVFNAGFSDTYEEFWRLYTNPTASLISTNMFDNTYYIGPYPSNDIKNRAYFQGRLLYFADIVTSSPTVQFGFRNGNDPRPTTPTLSWQVNGVVHNDQYNLHVQPQSGVDTDIQIDITGPCGKKTFNQPLTTNTVLSVPVAHC